MTNQEAITRLKAIKESYQKVAKNYLDSANCYREGCYLHDKFKAESKQYNLMVEALDKAIEALRTVDNVFGD